MGALNRLKEQGKIRHIGVSNYSGKEMAAACEHADVVSNQIKYNLLQRDIEQDALPWCREHDIGVICYSPMCMGLLTGKVTADRKFPGSDVRSRHAWFTPPNRRRVNAALEEVGPIAQQYGATFAQLSVAWVIAQQGITTALVGARTAKQVSENARAAELILTAEESATLRSAFESLGGPDDA